MGKKIYIYDDVAPSRVASPTTIKGLYLHPLMGPSTMQEIAESHDELQAGGGYQRLRRPVRDPGSLTKRQRLLLRTTEDDLRRRAISTIECRICCYRKIRVVAVFSAPMQYFRRPPSRTHLLQTMRGLLPTPGLSEAPSSQKEPRRMRYDIATRGRADDHRDSAAVRRLQPRMEDCQWRRPPENGRGSRSPFRCDRPGARPIYVEEGVQV